MTDTTFPTDIEERNQYILDQVKAQNFEVELVPITNQVGDLKATFWVFADALKIDGVRVNVSATTQQQIADMLGCSLLTALLADLTFVQSQTVIEPNTISMWKGSSAQCSSSTEDMIIHSQYVDADVAAKPEPHGLIGTVGKIWLIDNDISSGKIVDGCEVAMNYGWHVTTTDSSWKGVPLEVVASLMKATNGMYRRLIQGRGTKHNRQHTDYSQICVLVSQWVQLGDGSWKTIGEVLTDSTLAPLASCQGVLKITRQPGVPLEEVVVELIPPTMPGTEPPPSVNPRIIGKLIKKLIS